MSKKLIMRRLNIAQVISVYWKSLRRDFPASERRPLILILKGMMTGSYECLGAFYDGKIVGYAFFLKLGNDYLWDYLAIFEKYRCKGIGAKVVQAIKRYYKRANSVIGEVENPQFAGPNENGELMSRRLNFYFRNGCWDTGLRTVTFGVHFIIIQICGPKMDLTQLAKLYRTLYRTSLPEYIYKGNIRIEKPKKEESSWTRLI